MAESVPDITREKNAENNEDISVLITELIKQVERHSLETPANVSCEKNEFSPLCKSVNNTLNNSNSLGDKAKSNRSGGKKVRVRHHRKRKWKPYCKLTWQERKRVEERDSRRAYRSRERMSASGLTLAPYNTTQFLMEDHNLQEPDYEGFHHKLNKDDSHSYESEDDNYSTPSDEEEFLHQQFSETYDSFHDAYIHGLSKYELVSELMRLEDEIERVERSLKECRSKKSEYPGLDLEAELAKIQVFQNEIEKLTQENRVLEKKNEVLQNRISILKAD